MQTSQSLDRELATPRRVELEVKVQRGSVRVETADTDRTTVSVTGHHAEQTVVDHDGDQVRVVGPREPTGFRDGGGDVHVAVRVPHDSVLDVRTGSAGVTVAGRVDGGRVKTGSGDVRVELSAGPLLLETGSGHVAAGECTAPVRVKSGSGDVTVRRAHGPVAVSAGSGDVRVGESRGPVSVKTGSGDLEVDDAHDDVSLRSGSGALTVGTAHRGTVTARGASGRVDVGIPAGVPVWTDIQTLTGRVDSELASRGEPAPGQEHVEVRATLVSGHVRLREA